MGVAWLAAACGHGEVKAKAKDTATSDGGASAAGGGMGGGGAGAGGGAAAGVGGAGGRSGGAGGGSGGAAGGGMGGGGAGGGAGASDARPPAGADASQRADAATSADRPPASALADGGPPLEVAPPPGEQPIGFASLNGGVTGGAGGPVVTVTNGEDLKRYMDSNGPYVIQVSGTVNIEGMNHARPNKTIVGLGADAKIVGGGIYMYRSRNVIIRNLTFENANEDAIGITTNTTNIWVDHCTFSNAADGLLDIVRESNYITVSYCVFKNHVKTILIGHSDAASSDTGFLKVTLHHNWFQGTESRHPRVRFAEVHVFNNYYTSNPTYGVASTMEADVVVEGNHFQSVPFPCYVGYAESGPGDLVERNNVFMGSGACQTRGTAFDPRTYYPYSPDPAADIPRIVMEKAGAGKLATR